MSAEQDEGDGASITTKVLISIRDEIRALRSDTNERFGEMSARLDETNQRLVQLREDTSRSLAQLREETRQGLKAVHDSLSLRLDKVIENTGRHWRDLESRVTQLEQQVADLRHG